MFDESLFTMRPLSDRNVNSFLSKNSSNSIDMFRLIFVSFLNTPRSTKPLLFSEAILAKSNVFQKFCITASEKLIY